MKRLTAALAAGALLVGAYGIADAIDRAGDTRAELALALRESCMPQAGETAIIVSDGRRARCRILSTASTSPGMAPRLISAAVVELEVQP